MLQLEDFLMIVQVFVFVGWDNLQDEKKIISNMAPGIINMGPDQGGERRKKLNLIAAWNTMLS